MDGKWRNMVLILFNFNSETNDDVVSFTSSLQSRDDDDDFELKLHSVCRRRGDIRELFELIDF